MITEELERSLTRTHKVRLLKPSLPKFSWKTILREIRIGFLVAMVAFLLGSLSFFETSMKNFAQANLHEFHWLVMAQGDQVAVDEVGRFLRQLDGVNKVEFFSSAMLMDKMEKEGLSSRDLELIKVASLPPAWKVTWTASTNFQTLMNEILPDIKNFPGVVDVAFNSDVLKDYQRALAHSLQVQLCRSGFFFLTLMAMIVMLGQLLFFTSVSRKQFIQTWPAAVFGGVFWMLGILLFIGTVGSVPWRFWFYGGIAALFRGMFQLLWSKESQ